MFSENVPKCQTTPAPADQGIENPFSILLNSVYPPPLSIHIKILAVHLKHHSRNGHKIKSIQFNHKVLKGGEMLRVWIKFQTSSTTVIRPLKGFSSHPFHITLSGNKKPFSNLAYFTAKAKECHSSWLQVYVAPRMWWQQEKNINLSNCGGYI